MSVFICLKGAPVNESVRDYRVIFVKDRRGRAWFCTPVPLAKIPREGFENAVVKQAEQLMLKLAGFGTNCNYYDISLFDGDAADLADFLGSKPPAAVPRPNFAAAHRN